MKFSITFTLLILVVFTNAFAQINSVSIQNQGGLNSAVTVSGIKTDVSRDKVKNFDPAKEKGISDRDLQNAKNLEKSRFWFHRAETYQVIATSFLPTVKDLDLDKDALRKAYAAYQKVLSLEPTKSERYSKAENGIGIIYEAAVNQGVELYNAKQINTALAYIELANTIIPKDTLPILFLNQIALEVKDYDSFIKYADKTFQSDLSESTKINTHLGKIYLAKDEKKDILLALKHHEEAIKSFPKAASLWLIGIELYEKYQDIDQKMVYYQRAIKELPNVPEYPQYLGYAYSQKIDRLFNEYEEMAKKATTDKEKSMIVSKYKPLLDIEIKNALTPLERAEELLRYQNKPQDKNVMNLLVSYYNYLGMKEQEKNIKDKIKP